jgi:hypothetical protein
MGCRTCGKGRRVSTSTILTDKQQRLANDKPKVGRDGSLQFEGLAPTIKGYVHDRANPTRLLPDEVPCMERITLPVLGQNGIWVMNQCNHIGCPTRGQTVDEEVCSACPMRKVPTEPKLLGG